MKVKVLVVINSAWNFVNFRSGLISALISQGYEVVAVSPTDKYVPNLIEMGVRFIPVYIRSKGTNPVADLILFWNFWKIFKQEQPNICLTFTIKPNIYGALAARLLGIPIINNITGLGSVFSKRSYLMLLVIWLYRLALRNSKKVFFQNEHDLKIFLREKIVSKSISEKLPGSGVDLKKFSFRDFPANQKIRFLLVARMLWDKGVGEYVEAAQTLRKKGVDADFSLLGRLDSLSPNAISKDQIDNWVSNGAIHFLGESDCVENIISEHECIVLPSYYKEGVPRSLLEAAAIGRIIITTNTPGCSDVVDDGVNGFLCRPRDVNDLADKMESVMKLSQDKKVQMGISSRRKVETYFDEKIVIEKYLDVIKKSLAVWEYQYEGREN